MKQTEKSMDLLSIVDTDADANVLQKLKMKKLWLQFEGRKVDWLY